MKVRDEVTVASPVSSLEIAKATFPVGWAFRTTVKVSVVPLSATLVPAVSVIVKLEVSSSVVVTPTLIVARPE